MRSAQMTQRDQHSNAPQPGPGSAPTPATPSDGADPAANEAVGGDDADTHEYADALKTIEGEPRPQS